MEKGGGIKAGAGFAGPQMLLLGVRTAGAARALNA
jgi:hypothetical protein